MALDKFEKHIKKQLQEREIPPSADAWTKLKDQLASSPEPRKKGYLWYGIAASFIGVLFTFLWYFNSKEPRIEFEGQIVTTPNVSVQESVPEDGLKMKIEQDLPSIKSETKLKKDVVTTSPKISDTLKKNHLVLAENQNAEAKIVKTSSNRSEEIIDRKIAEVMVQVVELERREVAVSDAEIDSLLRQAQREILGDKIFRKDNSVDPTALLADVERELDKSFRDEIFDALKGGFIKVRTAVADRNK